MMGQCHVVVCSPDPFERALSQGLQMTGLHEPEGSTSHNNRGACSPVTFNLPFAMLLDCSIGIPG